MAAVPAMAIHMTKPAGMATPAVMIKRDCGELKELPLTPISQDARFVPKLGRTGRTARVRGEVAADDRKATAVPTVPNGRAGGTSPLISRKKDKERIRGSRHGLPRPFDDFE